jgi:hypothetical protein
MIKFTFAIPAWLGRWLDARSVSLAETHGRAGRGWSFLKGFIELNMRVEAKPNKEDD